MDPLKFSPAVPGMTPEQVANMMKLDQEMRVLLPQIIRTYNSKRFLLNSVLGALAAAAVGVIKSAPPDQHQNLYNAFNLVLRDGVFSVMTHVVPMPPPEGSPRGASSKLKIRPPQLRARHKVRFQIMEPGVV